MILFKTYFKIAFKNKVSILLYLGLTVVVSIIFISGDTSSPFDAQATKNIRVGLINQDTGAKNKGLITYLENNFTVIKTTEAKIKDGLFYGDYNYALRLKDDKYYAYQAPNTTNGYIVANYINNYLNTYESYYQTGLYQSEAELTEAVTKNLANTITLKDVAQVNKPENYRYFNMYAYGLLSAIIMGVGTVIVVLNKKNVYLRTIVSKMSNRKRNAIIFGCHFLLAFVLWLIVSLVSISVIGAIAFTPNFYMYLLNSFAFTIVCVGLAFLIGQLITSRNGLAGITNTLGLALSFLTGVFVPQYILSSFVLNIGKFTPSYWYVLNNDKIYTLANYDWSLILMPILIQLGFAVLFLGIGLVISNRKQKLA